MRAQNMIGYLIYAKSFEKIRFKCSCAFCYKTFFFLSKSTDRYVSDFCVKLPEVKGRRLIDKIKCGLAVDFIRHLARCDVEAPL